MQTKIILLCDLPIEPKHGALKNRVFEARINDQGAAVFTGDAGEDVCALSDSRREKTGSIVREYIEVNCD